MKENRLDKILSMFEDRVGRSLSRVESAYGKTKPFAREPMAGVDKLFLYETMTDAQKSQMVTRYGPQAFAKFESEVLKIKEKRGLE